MRKPSKSTARLIALKIRFLYRKVLRFIAWMTGYLRMPVTCDVYYVIEHEKGFSVKGRTLRVRKVRKPDSNDSRTRNFLEMVKNWFIPYRPNVEVAVTVNGTENTVKSDRNGYFECDFDVQPEGQAVVFDVQSSKSVPVEVKPVEWNPDKAEFLLISDIDDTLLVTNAGRLLRMIATTLLGNALTRQIFPGTSALYQGLKRGVNPICYVTSSPFNLNRLVSEVFGTNKIPGGAFLMSIWGMDETKWFKHDHHTHKMNAISIALSWYPSLPVILIGDSGEHDTDIYAEVANTNPGRIVDVLIRNVSSEEKLEQLDKRRTENGGDFDFFIFNDSMEAAEHLHENGRITDAVVEAVRLEIEESEESLLTTLKKQHQEHKDRLSP